MGKSYYILNYENLITLFSITSKKNAVSDLELKSFANEIKQTLYELDADCQVEILLDDVGRKAFLAKYKKMVSFENKIFVVLCKDELVSEVCQNEKNNNLFLKVVTKKVKCKSKNKPVNV